VRTLDAQASLAQLTPGGRVRREVTAASALRLPALRAWPTPSVLLPIRQWVCLIARKAETRAPFVLLACGEGGTACCALLRETTCPTGQTRRLSRSSALLTSAWGVGNVV
jgi:hypothetical protein